MFKVCLVVAIALVSLSAALDDREWSWSDLMGGRKKDNGSPTGNQGLWQQVKGKLSNMSPAMMQKVKNKLSKMAPGVWRQVKNKFSGGSRGSRRTLPLLDPDRSSERALRSPARLPGGCSSKCREKWNSCVMIVVHLCSSLYSKEKQPNELRSCLKVGIHGKACEDPRNEAKACISKCPNSGDA